ncbi:hypothetical protein PG995_004307 [Apiospora arundinis]
MEFTSQAVVGIVGIVVNLPPDHSSDLEVLGSHPTQQTWHAGQQPIFLCTERREPNERLRRLDQSLHVTKPTPAPSENSHVVLMMHLENIGSCLGIDTWLASDVYGWLVSGHKARFV